MKSKKETLRRDACKTCRMYLEMFKAQLLDKIEDKMVRTEKLSATSFIPPISD